MHGWRCDDVIGTKCGCSAGSVSCKHIAAVCYALEVVSCFGGSYLSVLIMISCHIML